MSNSAVEIANLLYRYAESMDGGDLPGVAVLFRHAQVKIAGSDALLDEAGMLELWRQYVRIHPCGTPRTKHVITNPIIELDETAGKATCRSYYTVLQATDAVPLQVIAAGRYHDGFERVEGQWRFCYRDYSLFDLKGDLSDHLRITALG